MSTKPSDQCKSDLNLWLGLMPTNRYFEKPADVDVYSSQLTFLSEIQKYLKRLESALSLPCSKLETFTWCGVLEEPMSSGKNTDGSHALSMTMCSMRWPISRSSDISPTSEESEDLVPIINP